MPALGRRRRRHRPPLTAPARPRRSVVVDLPEAPGSVHRPAPLVLPLTTGRPVWHLPDGRAAAAGLATLLAVLDLAPPGPLLALVGDTPEHALLAAVYSRRLVRAVATDGLVAHAARQAAATNALPLVVEERPLAGAGSGPAGSRGTTLDDYAGDTGLQPAVLHLGAGTDARAVLAGAAGVLAEHHPWVVVTGGRGAAAAASPATPEIYEVVPDAGAPGVYVLAPGAAAASLQDRIATWSDALAGMGQARSAAVADPRAADPRAGDLRVIDLREDLTARR